MEKIPGGLAKGKSIKDIASKHKVDVSIIKSQLAKGIKVEMEHTTSKDVAKEIAMDHLMEDPKYYDKLKLENSNTMKKNNRKKSDKLKIKNIIKESMLEAGPRRISKNTHYNTISWGDLVRAVAFNYADYFDGNEVEGGIENDLLDLDTYDIEGLLSVLDSAGMDTNDAIDFIIKSILD